jgi:hypothetical protein
MTPNALKSKRSDSNILKISTPLILISTTVFKFFVFDHENSQIKIKKITKILKKCLPTYPPGEGVRYQNHNYFF